MSATELVFASGNLGKLKEVQKAFSDFDCQVRPQSDFGITSPEETGMTFIENAILKARYASKHSNCPAFADDSGLAVKALRGAPGIHSARFASTDASDQENIEHLLMTLAQTQDRQAKFICILAFVAHADDPLPIIAQGVWHGHIAQSCQGSGGFGYDPVFLLDKGCSAAEISLEQKNQLSHRGQAIQKLKEKLRPWLSQ